MTTVMNALSLAAPNLDNDALGTLAKGLDANTLGAALRPILGSLTTDVVTGPVNANKSPELPTDPAMRSVILDNVYSSFDSYRRRSVGALANATGLTPEAVLSLVSENTDFRVSEGQSGRTFVSLNGLN